MKAGKLSISRFNEGLTVFKPDYYLNEGKKVISDLLDKGIENTTLAKISVKLYQGGIFKRVFNQEGDKALKYITASDMVKTHPLDTAKDISKKFTPWVEEMTLKTNQILVSCAGSVGNAVLVNESYSGCIGSQEIIRIEDTSIPFGYLYAYLSTPLVYQYIQSMIYGAVVPRISPDEIGRLPVLLADNTKQEEIHNLIVEASNLRVKANKLLRESINLIDLEINFQNVKHSNTGSSKISSLLSNYQKRLDSPTYINSSVEHKKTFSSEKYSTLKSLGFKVYRPGIFKRIKVDSTNGLPYIKGSELNKLNPFSTCEFLSRTRTPFLNELKLFEDQILFTCAGTVGDVKLISKEFEEKHSIGSQDIIRIEKGNSAITIYYLFAYLNTKFANNYVQSMKYGSVIERVEPFHVEMIPIYLFSEDKQIDVSTKVAQYKNLLYEAFKSEEKAIDLVEKEIESWQK
jgi:type I restriction enzyme S subunit